MPTKCLYFVLFVMELLFIKDIMCQKMLRRLEFLEMQVAQESLRSKTNMIELRESIEYLNTTCGKDPQDVITSDTDLAQDLEKMSKELQEFMEYERKSTLIISKAISKEKAKLRELIKSEKDLNAIIECEKAQEKAQDDMKALANRIQAFENGLKTPDVIQDQIDDINNRLMEMSGQITTLLQREIMVKKGACPEGWTKWENMCYLYVTNEAVNWYGAAIRCDSLGGILAEPDTEKSMRHLLSFVGDNVWLGASDYDVQGTWIWSTSQKKVTFFVWESGQPNNLRGKQDCMEVFKRQLNDDSCSENNNYVCQKSVTVN